MKKILNRFRDAFSIGALMIMSLIYGILFLVTLAYGIFGWKLDEHYKGLYLSKTSYLSGFYFEGIPLKLHSGSMVLPEKNNYKYEAESLHKSDMQHWHDSLAQKVSYQWTRSFKDLPSSEIDNYTMEKYIVYVKPHNRSIRIILLLNRMVTCLFWCFVCWNGALFLDRIKQQIPFDGRQTIRLKIMGYAAIIYGIALLIIDSVVSYFAFSANYNIAEGSSISFFGQVERSDTLFWLIVGAIFFIIAKAFGQGQSLQQEQDLTI